MIRLYNSRFVKENKRVTSCVISMTLAATLVMGRGIVVSLHTLFAVREIVVRLIGLFAVKVENIAVNKITIAF